MSVKVNAQIDSDMGFTQFRTFLLQQVLIFTENLDLVHDEDQEDLLKKTTIQELTTGQITSEDTIDNIKVDILEHSEISSVL